MLLLLQLLLLHVRGKGCTLNCCRCQGQFHLPSLVLIGVPPGCLLFSSAVAAATDLCLHLLQIINYTHTHTNTHVHTRLVANVGRASNDCASDRR